MGHKSSLESLNKDVPLGRNNLLETLNPRKNLPLCLQLCFHVKERTLKKTKPRVQLDKTFRGKEMVTHSSKILLVKQNFQHPWTSLSWLLNCLPHTVEAFHLFRCNFYTFSMHHRSLTYVKKSSVLH